MVRPVPSDPKTTGNFEIGFGSALDAAGAMLELVEIADPARMLRRASALGEALAPWIIDGAADGPFADAAGARGREMPQRAVAS